MQEEAEPIGKSHIAQRTRERDEMIVMDPDRVALVEQLGKPPREGAVDPEKAGGVLRRIFCKIEPVMADRPECAVGEAVIKFFEIASAEIGDRVADGAVAAQRRRRFRHVIGLAGPAEPESPAGL